VVAAFLNHLRRVQTEEPAGVLSDVVTLLLGVLALFMRQTNVFWVVVFMGGLEAAFAAKKVPSKVKSENLSSGNTLWGRCKLYTEKYASGDVHDPPLRSAWPDGEFRDVCTDFLPAILY
jgi:alpha-1,2-glucosyltransferase